MTEMKKSKRTNVPQPTRHALWAACGNRCAMCDQVLTEDLGTHEKSVTYGKIAHIAGEQETSARYDPNMTEKERNSFSNLLILCGVHHDKIDAEANVSRYTVEQLETIKADHEQKVADALVVAFPQVTFAELQIVMKHFVTAEVSLDGSLVVVPPKKKIAKNGLSPGTEKVILMGLSVAGIIEDFLKRQPDLDFGNRLRTKFVNKYQEHYDSGLRGDDLFVEIMRFATAGVTNDTERAAAIAVIAFLFERCDIFEK